ncbi:MAG: hypothetical protein JNL72_03965 [Flavipsychrobacter sp.]|nr:hypothetical protein [Flavipsychrobacter sp.]
MWRILLAIIILLFIPYVVLRKSEQLKNERQARVRYYIFIFVVVLVLVLVIRRL